MSSVEERFASLFQGSSHKHGHSQLTGQSKASGKQETKNWTAEGPATAEHWKKHLEGTLGVGVIPIRRDTSDCRFGAIDIDVYNDNTTLEEVNKAVLAEEIPVCVCRSKSGGAHLFLFVRDWVPATLMREKLELIAAYLGHSTAELFPAQAALNPTTADGNWINMPYFGPGTLRYCLRQDNSAMGAEEFLDYANRTILNREQLEKLSYRKEAEPLFPDGPPCLDAIFQKVRRGLYTPERNKTLFAVSVYANNSIPGEDKKKEREALVLKANSLFSEPLSLAELTKTIFASDKRGRPYKYQCSECPLKEHCNSAVCKTRKYGIKAYNGSVLRSLAKVETDPPTWVLTINDKPVNLSTEELCNYQKLQKSVVEQINVMPPYMKTLEWQEYLDSLLKNVHIIHTFEDYTETSDLVEQIHIYLFDKAAKTVDTESDLAIKSLVNGTLYYEGDRCTFLPSKLYEYLKREQKEKRKLVDRVLVEYFQAKEVRPNLEPRRRCFSVPVIYTKVSPQLNKTR